MSSPCASTHASASCDGVQPLSVGDRLDRVDEAQVLLEVLALEARRVAPVVVRRQIVDALDLAGEKAAPERAVGDEADAELAARWPGSRPRDRGSTASTRSAARRWGARRARGGWSPAPLRTGRGSAPCPGATSSAIAPTVSSIGVVGVDAVLVVEVDDIDAEAAQARLARLADVLRPAVDAANLPSSAAHVAELGGDNHLLAAPADRPPDQLLVACPGRTCPRCRES